MRWIVKKGGIILYDIIKHYPKVAKELVEKFAKLSESASINEVMATNHAMSNVIRPVWPGMRCCGVALTVCSRPGDNLMLHKAISMGQPGDVIVIDCGDYDECGGMFGGNMSNACQTRGIVGLVTNGCVRDTMMQKKIGFPVFAKGISVRRSTKHEPGTINHQVIVGGIPVNPGDLIFADNDGIVVVPREEAEGIYEKAYAREAYEDANLSNILKDGSTTFKTFAKEFAALHLSEEAD